MISRRCVLTAAAAAPLAAPVSALAQSKPTPPSIRELTREAELTDATISPNGKVIAVIHRVKKEDARGNDLSTGRVAFHRVEDLDRPLIVDIPGTAAQLFWVNDDTVGMLLAAPGMTYAQSGNRRVIISKGLNFRDLDMLFINRDGKRMRKLSELPPIRRSSLTFLDLVKSSAEDGRTILVKLIGKTTIRNEPGLYAVDVVGETLDLVERGIIGTDTWYCSGSTPLVRTDINYKTMRVYARAPGEDSWKLARTVSYREFQQPDFDIIAADPSPGVMLVTTTPEGAATRGLYRWDLRTNEIKDLVSARSNRDVEGCVMDRHGALVATTFTNDCLSYEFTDKSLKPFFDEINEAFHGVNNVRIRALSDDRKRMVLHISGSTEAGQFVYFDRELGGIGYLGDQRPWLRPERLARTIPADVASRDGGKFRAYLTVPLQTGPRPLVVMPHGGPEVRDSLQFDQWAQALAAQGWVVLQPNFRGSGGYGRAFAEQGHGQWNGRIMEDIEDATDQLLKSNLVDPKRVAIMGASFGGYAALMAPARKPERYCGVVSFAGVSDLERMMDYETDIGGPTSEIARYWAKRMAGVGASSLVEASPIKYVDKYRAPVLLVHGLLDETVPPVQSDKMHEALRRAGKSSELIRMEEHGHGGFDSRVTEAFLSKTTTFLADCFAKVR